MSKNKFKYMKKILVIFTAVAVLFIGSANGVGAQSSSSSDSSLLAQLFDMVQDLSKAMSAIIERQIDNISNGISGNSDSVQKAPSPVPAPQPAPKPSPEPGVISFKVTSPASGERWVVGKSYEVKWENDNPTMGAIEQPNFVSLYLVSTNNASKRPSVLWTVAAYTRNTGTYKWIVSKNVYPGEYMLAVEPYARPDRRSYGGTFSVVSDATLPPASGPWFIGPVADPFKTVGALSETNKEVANILPTSLPKEGTPAFVYYSPFPKDASDRLKACKLIQMGPPLGGVQVCFGGGAYSPGGGGGTEVRIYPPEADGRGSCMIINMGTPLGNVRVCFNSGGGNAPIGGQETEFKVKITNPSEVTDAALVKGKPFTVRWESSDPSVPLKETDLVSIYAVSTKDVTKSLWTISSRAYNDGDFRTTVSSRLADGMYKIVIQSVKNASLKAMSSEFSVSSPSARAPKNGDVLFTKNGQQTKIGEGGYISDRPVWCCNNCYGESGGTCGGCFAHCGGSTNY